MKFFKAYCDLYNTSNWFHLLLKKTDFLWQHKLWNQLKLYQSQQLRD